MKKIGLTGGIGSGKSTIAQLFASFGTPVYNCDKRAKELMATDAEILRSLSIIIGDDAVVDGQLNRAKIASVIFADEYKLQQINAIVHPAVGRDFLRWCEHRSAEGHKYVICEAALMVGTNMEPLMDNIIAVSLPLEVRIERTMQRDNASRGQVEARIAHQISDETLTSHADFIIHPDDKHLIINEILTIHKKLIE